MKMFKSFFMSALLSLVILGSLSACQSKATTPVVQLADESDFPAKTWVNTHPYYGKGYTFELLDDEALGNRDVFVVKDELELALLIAIFYDYGVYDVYYTVNHELDLNKTLSYVLAISPYEVWWEDFTVDLGTKAPIYSADLVYEFNSYHEVNQKIHEYNFDYNSSYYTDKEKTEYAYSMLMAIVEYDDDAALLQERTTAEFDAYGALVNGQAVCNGYALAYLGMLKALNIPAIMISSDVEDHAWNMVYYENEWLFFDATFEDTDGVDDLLNHYYGMTYEELDEDHEFDVTSEYNLSYEEYMNLVAYAFPQTKS